MIVNSKNQDASRKTSRFPNKFEDFKEKGVRKLNQQAFVENVSMASHYQESYFNRRDDRSDYFSKAENSANVKSRP